MFIYVCSILYIVYKQIIKLLVNGAIIGRRFVKPLRGSKAVIGRRFAKTLRDSA